MFPAAAAAGAATLGPSFCRTIFSTAVFRAAMTARQLVCPAAARAQSVSGTILGTVTDPSGAVVPGVHVKVTNLDTNISQTAVSNAVGD